VQAPLLPGEEGAPLPLMWVAVELDSSAMHQLLGEFLTATQ
jgi:hypothetical protein